MKLYIKFSFMVSIILLLLILPLVSGFMPKNTHKLIWQKSIDIPINSDGYLACVKYPSLCYTGNVLADVSVQWYWLKGEKYDLTHAPNFCRALIESSIGEKDLACAYGGCAHQPSDMVSHNEMVPYSIEHSLLINFIIHMFAEQKVDNWVEKNYPGIGDQALNYMADYEQCTPLFKKVMMGSEEYSDLTEGEIDNVFDKFIAEIYTSQTGYDVAFKNKSFLVNYKALPVSLVVGYTLIMIFWGFVLFLLLLKLKRKEAKTKHFVALLIFGLLFGIMFYIFVANAQGKAFQAIIRVIKPISELAPLGNTPEFYINKAVQNTKMFFQQGPVWLLEQAQKGDGILASGRIELAKVDRKILFYDYLILGGLFAFFFWYIRFLFKKNKFF